MAFGVKPGKPSVFATQSGGFDHTASGMYSRGTMQQPPAAQVGAAGGRLSAFGGGPKPPMSKAQKTAIVMKFKGGSQTPPR